ncbi:hypothetical protein FRB91_008738 [Serendipita sp. 411]|nr:hypothetical protein FRB91_008738 [Serendipita sp. 411]
MNTLDMSFRKYKHHEHLVSPSNILRFVALTIRRAMMHDETVYSDPERFIPERFLGEDRDSALATFGFGRRTCPGMHTAQDTLYILAASIIHAFEISPPNDLKGSSSLPEVKYTTGLISHPFPFSCSFRPRSKAVVAIIKDGSLEG